MVTQIHYFLKSGQDREANDEKLGCSGFTSQKNADLVNLEDMVGSGDKNWPYPVKDVSVYLKLIYFFQSPMNIGCLIYIKTS